ncbi:mycothiol transferase [Angustibacter luteus]|uniref:DUF664 domain-containing protein n=1 Tax=Angustibacter luteus TaxID=658456 RepID=A0ABW1JBG0_9ACTN
MDAIGVLQDAIGRITERGHEVCDGLSPELANERLDGRSNSIAWLVWHAARVADTHVGDALGADDVWRTRGWHERFGLALGSDDTGYGHTSEQVGQVQVNDASLLTGYLDDVIEVTRQAVDGLTDTDLDRVVDEGWDPPVTLGVRLVSVIDDDLEHLGQAAFLKGVLEDR